MNTHRIYRSSLRQEQVQQTRERILEGLLRALGQSDIQDLSIPDIAREAGVSVPTVYRYFKTRQELIQALALYSVQKVNMEIEPVHDPESLIQMIRKSFAAYASSNELFHASRLSEESREIRAELFPWRLKIIEEALVPVLDHFEGQADLMHVRDIIFLLTTTSAISLFKDVLGRSEEEAAETVAWTIRHLIGSPQENNSLDTNKEP